MDLNLLAEKILEQGEEPEIASNCARAFMNSPSSFLGVLEKWVSGEQPDYEYNDISLSFIQEKEKCSYYAALLRMQLLLGSPSLAKGYKKWTPVNKDRNYANYYLTFGYPLMVAPSSNADGYVVEVSNEKTLVVSNDIALLWANLLSSDSSDDFLSIQKLAELGLVLSGQTKSDLLNQCQEFRPVRQGIGSTQKVCKEDGDAQLLFAVRLGKENYTFSDFQRHFWINANGEKTVSSIINSVPEECSSLSEEEIANQLFVLIKYGLLFFKK